MSIKVEMMVDHIKNNNKHYVLMSKKTLKAYLRNRFKCSPYMANTAIDKLFNQI